MSTVVENIINSFLGIQRFPKESNIVYKIPLAKLPKRQYKRTDNETMVDVVNFKHEEMKQVVSEFINHHKENQVPRLEALKRYYNTQNDIKQRAAKTDEYRADNRIASDFAKFQVTFKRGVVIGNPLAYSGPDKVVELVQEFNTRIDEDSHNQMMFKDMLIFGRGYELIHYDAHGKECISKLDPIQTFIIYDTTLLGKSIAGVRYYDVEYSGKKTTNVEIYSSEGFTYHFVTDSGDLLNAELLEDFPKTSPFQAVQVNEWRNDEEMTGDYENALDIIDAYDLSQSELANFQQDSSDAYLVVSGNPFSNGEDEKSDKELLREMRKARMLILGESEVYPDGTRGAESKAYYLKKEYDTSGVEAYKDRLVADFLRFTCLIDFTDDNMGGSQTGIGLRFKGWGSDNDRKNKERQVKKAIRRRMRILSDSWSVKERLNEKGLNKIINAFKKGIASDKTSLYNQINEIEIKFTPNIPQSDKETMEVIKGMYGVVSDETIYNMATRLTGVKAEEEIKRVLKEEQEKMKDAVTDMMFPERKSKEGLALPSSGGSDKK